mmetsp:Transcript_7192/g.14834  ORF Transcript_7192/g.14834 Transcript_7192/m.14834 type:complete len:115 (+) Transcript_7192:507-851(+)
MINIVLKDCDKVVMLEQISSTLTQMTTTICAQSIKPIRTQLVQPQVGLNKAYNSALLFWLSICLFIAAFASLSLRFSSFLMKSGFFPTPNMGQFLQPRLGQLLHREPILPEMIC